MARSVIQLGNRADFDLTALTALPTVNDYPRNLISMEVVSAAASPAGVESYLITFTLSKAFQLQFLIGKNSSDLYYRTTNGSSGSSGAFLSFKKLTGA